MLNILLIENENSSRDTIGAVLRGNGHSVIQCSNGDYALDKIQSVPFDLVFSDSKMLPDNNLDELLNIKKRFPSAEVIIISAESNVSMAVKALKIGAYDFIEKHHCKEKVLRLVNYFEKKKILEEETTSLRAKLLQTNNFDAIIGNSRSMLHILEIISQVSQADTTILISGESGTGKELVARAIYVNSPRRNNQIITVNCGALPESLQESELFGHVKGSFTGAIKDKKGLFEEAHNGTVFLDEIGEMSLSAQVKLLRFLQDGEIRRVGDNHPIRINVRLIAATNKDLESEIKTGSFRQDLYYRLSVIPIIIPPLRRRKEDIPLLIDHFINKYCKKLCKNNKTVSQKTMRILQDYHWPGNVRELENAIERAIVLTNGTMITVSTLPNHITHQQHTSSSSAIFLGLSLAEVIKRHILTTLQDSDNDIKRAALRLGIADTDLMSKIKQYKMTENQAFDTSELDTEQITEDNIVSIPSGNDANTQKGLSTILTDMGITLSQLEKKYIIKVLEKTRGNQRKASQILGLSQVTLWRKLNEFNISGSNEKSIKQRMKSNLSQDGILSDFYNYDNIVDGNISNYLKIAVDKGYTLNQLENQHVLDTLHVSKGKKQETAFRLGISKATLWRKLKTLQPKKITNNKTEKYNASKQYTENIPKK